LAEAGGARALAAKEEEEVSPMRGLLEERRLSENQRLVERAIVLQLLRDDREERWTREQLAREIADLPPAALERALVRLRRDGVLCRDRSTAWAAGALRRLDELELIGV
jgi:hypothetical protein